MKYLIVFLGIFALSSGVFSQVVTCNRVQCFQSNQCPSAPEMEETMASESMECRMCVANTCGPYDANNASLVEECLIEARAECMSCSDTDREQMRSCMTCYRVCRIPGSTATTPPRDRDAVSRLEMLRAQRATCQNECESTDYCQSDEEMMMRRTERETMCKSCVRDMCGEFTREDLTNRTLSICVFRAQIGDCRSPCLTGNGMDQENNRNCSMCVSGCVRQAQKSPCLRICEMEGGCPTDEEREMERQERVQMCKTCVRSICGEFEISDYLREPELRTCVNGAQQQNCTDSCSRNTMSSFDEDCMACVEECEAEVPDVAGMIEEEMEAEEEEETEEDQITATFDGAADFDIEN